MMRDIRQGPLLTVVLVVAVVTLFVMLVVLSARPAPIPAAPVRVDTVWLGCTWVETKDGKVIVKYERLMNPVLWDTTKEAK